MNSDQKQRLDVLYVASMSFTLVLTMLQPALGNDPSFEPLGGFFPESTHSEAHGVSSDGATVVGLSEVQNGFHAFVWTASTGMVDLGDFPGRGNVSGAYACSHNGETIIGGSYRWEQGGAIRIPFPDCNENSVFTVYDTSSSGTKSVGFCIDSNVGQAVAWSEQSGFVLLGDLPDGGLGAIARAISGDGRTVVGVASSGAAQGFADQAFIWRERSGVMMGLGDLEGGEFRSIALGISDLGGVVVGWSESEQGRQAFRWTNIDGMVGLGDLPGGNFHSIADATCGDGTIVVGVSGGDGNEAFIWTESEGMRLISDVISVDYGLDLHGWKLIEATDISADGKTIVGYGLNPSGDIEAWRAVLPGNACIVDYDNDGVFDAFDPCPFTPAYLSTDATGRPVWDLNGDCNVDGADVSLIIAGILGGTIDPADLDAVITALLGS